MFLNASQSRQLEVSDPFACRGICKFEFGTFWFAKLQKQLPRPPCGRFLERHFFWKASWLCEYKQMSWSKKKKKIKGKGGIKPSSPHNITAGCIMSTTQFFYRKESVAERRGGRSVILLVTGHAERLSHAPLTNDLIPVELWSGEPRHAPARQDTSSSICQLYPSLPFLPLSLPSRPFPLYR